MKPKKELLWSPKVGLRVSGVGFQILTDLKVQTRGVLRFACGFDIGA